MVIFQDAASILGILPLNSGQATLSTSIVGGGAGLDTVSAVYSGDGCFVGNTSGLSTQTITRAGTTTTLMASVSSAVFGQAVIFTATVNASSPGSGTPGSVVTFLDGTAAIGVGWLNSNGVAPFATKALTVATYTIKAVYGGDSNFTGSTMTLPETIAKANCTTLMSFPTNPVGKSQQVTYTAVVLANYPGRAHPPAASPSGTVLANWAQLHYSPCQRGPCSPASGQWDRWPRSRPVSPAPAIRPSRQSMAAIATSTAAPRLAQPKPFVPPLRRRSLLPRRILPSLAKQSPSPPQSVPVPAGVGLGAGAAARVGAAAVP